MSRPMGCGNRLSQRTTRAWSELLAVRTCEREGRLGKSRKLVERSPVGTRLLELRSWSLSPRHKQHNNYVVAEKCYGASYVVWRTSSGHNVVADWTVPSQDHPVNEGRLQ